MYMPNGDKAIVDDAKITDYLLNLRHPDGGPKAKYFFNKGYTLDAPEILKRALVEHAKFCQVTKVERTQFGTKYIVEGAIATPKEPEVQLAYIRTVWMEAAGSNQPKLVTAYPYKP